MGPWWSLTLGVMRDREVVCTIAIYLRHAKVFGGVQYKAS